MSRDPYYGEGQPHQGNSSYPPQGYPPAHGGSPYPPQSQSPYDQPPLDYPAPHQNHQQVTPYPPQYPDQSPFPPGHGPPGSDVELGADGATGDRGLGSIALGAATGGFVGHKAGHHGILGALGGALTAGVVDHFRSKSKDRKNSRRDDDDDGLAYGDSGRHSRPSSGYGPGSSYAGSSVGGGSALHPDDANKHHHHHRRHGSGSHSRHRSSSRHSHRSRGIEDDQGSDGGAGYERRESRDSRRENDDYAYERRH